jgi:hypothetical protein
MHGLETNQDEMAAFAFKGFFFKPIGCGKAQPLCPHALESSLQGGENSTAMQPRILNLIVLMLDIDEGYAWSTVLGKGQKVGHKALL